MATGKTGVAGNVALTSPDVTLAGSLVTLPDSLTLPGATLVLQCGQKLGDVDMSSFNVTGKGGTSLMPDGWQPDTDDGTGWILMLTPGRDRPGK